MRLNETRRANLGKILMDYAKDMDFADLLEPPMVPARLSQLKNGHENIGNKAAEQIEKAAGKQPGWLDIPTEIQQVSVIYQAQPHDTLSEEERILVENFRALCPDQKAALKTVSNALAQSAPNKKAG